MSFLYYLLQGDFPPKEKIRRLRQHERGLRTRLNRIDAELRVKRREYQHYENESIRLLDPKAANMPLACEADREAQRVQDRVQELEARRALYSRSLTVARRGRERLEDMHDGGFKDFLRDARRILGDAESLAPDTEDFECQLGELEQDLQASAASEHAYSDEDPSRAERLELKARIAAATSEGNVEEVEDLWKALRNSEVSHYTA